MVDTIQQIALWALPVLVAIIFHEVSHGWVAYRLGDPTAARMGRLTLNPLAHIDWVRTVLFPLIAMTTGFPLIGWAKPVPVNGRNLGSPRRDFAIVALAGPVSNVLLASAGAVVFFVMLRAGATVGTWSYAVVVRFVELNVLLAVFNMIPVPPLDGGEGVASELFVGAVQPLDGLRGTSGPPLRPLEPAVSLEPRL